MASFDSVDGEATWFIDPPYSGNAGGCYKYKKIDYESLAVWCRNRIGQVIVCENEGATWLPFKPFREIKGTEGRIRSGVSKEVIWLNNYGTT